MLETAHGNFEIIKNHKDAIELKEFNDRYVDYLDKYPIIVCDYSAQMLRFKGFTDENHHMIPDYLLESCTPNAPYYVLRRMNKE